MLDKLVEKNRLTPEKNKQSVCGVGEDRGTGKWGQSGEYLT